MEWKLFLGLTNKILCNTIRVQTHLISDKVLARGVMSCDNK